MGVDIGGTKTLLGVFSDNGKLEHQTRFETPPTYHAFLSLFRRFVAPLSVDDLKAAGVAAPGKINRAKGTVISFGNLKWKNVPLQKDMEQILSAPVVLENDANLAGLSEAKLITDKYKKVLYITISTGIGTGIITNGVIDPEFADSEGGFLLLPYGDKLVRWEKFASGKAIHARYGKLARDIKDVKTWKDISHNLAIGITNLLPLIQPEVIVIGGGVGAYFERFDHLLKTELKKNELPIVPVPPLLKAKRPEDAVIYGCYQIAKQIYAKST